MKSAWFGLGRKSKLLAGGSFWAVGWISIFTCIALTYSYWPNADKSSFLHLEKVYLPPFQQSHNLLGTDQLGRDLLFYLFHACQTAWLITFPPLIVASSIGIFLGFLAGYYGDKGCRTSWLNLFLIFLILLASFSFYPIYQWRIAPYLFPDLRETNIYLWSYIIFWILLFFSLYWAGLSQVQKTIAIPFNSWITGGIDMWSTLPKLLLLLLLSAFTSPSLWSLMGWIAISYWTLPARLTKSKVMELKNTAFIEAAQAIGLTTQQIFFQHICPSLKGPILTNFCFAASGLLGIGASLAYLGIGLPPEIPSWGKMLSTARFSLTAWWLLFFPALFLLLSIFSLQTLGHKISSNKKY